GVAVAVVSLVWGLRERPRLLVTAWGALLVASLLGFAVIPGSLSIAAPRERAAADSDTALAAERRRLQGLAFRVPTLAGHAPPDTWPALRPSGIALRGWWRRTALAWALQSPALARRETDGLVLLWRRDVLERVARLAPFASFDDAVPVVVDSALWWVAYGYFEAEAFPLARPVAGGDRDSVRYLRAGLVGAVNAASGDTRLYLAPGADALA